MVAEVELEGSWFPDAFIGTMGSLMRYKLGETDVLPTSVEDVINTMALVESAYVSSDSGGVVVAVVVTWRDDDGRGRKSVAGCG